MLKPERKALCCVKPGGGVNKMYLKADLDHVALTCQDVEKQLSFYLETIKLAPCRVQEYRDGKAPFPSVRLSELTILDFFPSKQEDPLPSPSSSAHICLAIARTDFPDLRRRLEAAGLNVREPVTRSGARGDGHSIYVRDPERNLIEFRYY